MLFPPCRMFFLCSAYRNSSIHICFRKLSLILQWRITHSSAFPSYFNTSIIGRSFIPFVILILLFVFVYNNFFSHWTFNFWRISNRGLLIFLYPHLLYNAWMNLCMVGCLDGYEFTRVSYMRPYLNRGFKSGFYSGIMRVAFWLNWKYRVFSKKPRRPAQLKCGDILEEGFMSNEAGG